MNELKPDTTRADAESRITEALMKAGIKMAPRYQTRSFTQRYVWMGTEDHWSYPMQIDKFVNRKLHSYGKSCCIEIAWIEADYDASVGVHYAFHRVGLRTWASKIK
jgi:hypothetical protein